MKKRIGFITFILFALIFVSPQLAGAQEKQVTVLDVDGSIVPVVERYIDRGITIAEEEGSSACVILLNTPGGLYDTTQDIVKRIMNSEVPVIVYVSPSGGWAGSAGTFITLSANVAAMAPGSRIGAAHPVGGGGQELSPVQDQKITEDAAAWARSIAETRNRDSEKAALAVTESKSYTDQEAMQNNLIDIQASDLNSLLAEANGSEVTLGNGERQVLDVGQAEIVREEMNFNESLLHQISEPNLVYILIMVGMLGLILEFSNPGLIFPGVIGAISLLVSLYSAGTLDASWTGVLLIMLGFGLFIAEMFITSFGLLSLGGVVSLFAGSVLLFSKNTPAGPQLSYGLIAIVVLGVTAVMVFVVYAVVKAHRNRVTTGRESFEGEKGVAVTDLNPKGRVLFQGERWNAVSEGGEIKAGKSVIVTRLEGLTIYVIEEV